MKCSASIVGTLAGAIAILVAASAPPAATAAQRVDSRQQERDAERRARDREREQDRERRDSAPAQTERVSRTLQVDPNGELEISNVAGNVTVTGGGGRELRVDGTKRVRGPDTPETRQQLALLEMRVEQRGPRVEIGTEGFRGRRGSIDYEIRLPATMRVTLRSVSGSLSVTNVKGDVRVQTVNGNVRVTGADRLVLAKSVSGEVDLGSIGSDGDLSVGSVSGGVTARGVRARGLEIETVSGDLSLTDITVERTALRTVSGDVSYTGPLARSGRYVFTVHSGDVRLTFANQTGFELKASSFSGDIRTALPITIRPAERDTAGPGNRTRTLTGVYGDGSALVEVSTFSGDVEIGRP
jgi:DUF4097 and DUF4098 domain-containing protein YvlB